MGLESGCRRFTQADGGRGLLLARVDPGSATPATDEAQEFPILGRVRDVEFQGLESMVG